MKTIESLFRDLSDGVCISGDDGRILYLNPAAERLLGVEPLVGPNGTSCALLCSKMSPGGAEFVMRCPLKDRKSEQRSVSFRGRHSPSWNFQWKDDGIFRRPASRDLRVRCGKMKTDFFGTGEKETHFILIEDVSK